jgi:molybdopterin/thiamine biosynthesis adenylyltransferase
MMIQTEYKDIVQRNIGVISWEEQNKIKNINVSNVGLSDQGISSVLVAKIGFNRINLIDDSKVELNDLNSEFLATVDRINQNKTDVAKDVIKKHNPFVECDTFQISNTITVKEAKEAIKDSHYCIISTKNPYIRIVASRAAEELGMPYVISMDIGFKVLLVTFGKGNGTYESLTKQPSLGKELTNDLSDSIYAYQLKFIRAADTFLQGYEEDKDLMSKSTSIVSNFVANLSVAEVVKMVLGKGKVHYAPDIYAMDLLMWKQWDLHQVIEKIN